MVSGAVFGNVTFKVTDSGNPQQTALKTIRMTFRWALSITNLPIPVAAGHINVPYKEAFYAGDANGNVTWSVPSGQLPPGLSLTNLTSSEADLVGTPTQPGTYDFTVQVVDSSSPPQTATKAATVTIDSKFAIATVTLPIPFANEPYSQTLSAVNGTLPFHWSMSFSYGLTIDANTGTISGTPAQGNYFITVSVTDSSNPPQTAQQGYGLLILPRLKITSATLPDAHLSQSYYTNINHDGGQGNLVWTVVSGSLPAGLTLQPQYGILSGTPSQLGSFPFTVQLQDSSTPPQVVQAQLTLNVKAATLSLQSSLPSRIPINVPFDGSATATGGTLPITWTMNAGVLPPGLNLEQGTGRVSGTPTTAGVYTATIRATDSSNPQQTDTHTYTITVGAALGRNDIPSRATPLGNSGFQASISPLLDPPTGTTLSPDTDYYKITGAGGGTIKIVVTAYSNGSFNSGALDPVLEIVDANGSRLSACRLPGDTSSAFNSACMNDDIVAGVNRNSQLEYLVPGTPDTTTDIYAHVLDWRGDARPDMLYTISVSGAFVPLNFQTAATLPDCAVKAQCYFNMSASGGSGTLTATITAGTLPPGSNLVQGSFTGYDGSGSSWTGTITGTPTSSGTYPFTLALSDSSTPQQTVSRQFTITVAPAISLATIPAQTLTAGQTTTYQPSATGGLQPYFWSLPGSPSWITINQNTGLITFQPTTAGQYSMQVWVSGTCSGCGGTLWTYQVVSVTVNP